MTIKGQTPSFLAWLGGYANAQDDLSQVVTVPAGATSITLSFYYAISTAETTQGAFDVMDVYTYDPAASEYTSVATFNDNMATPPGTWTRFSATLPLSLAGRPIKFGFQATTDVNKNTNFFIDSVSLDVSPARPDAAASHRQLSSDETRSPALERGQADLRRHALGRPASRT